MTRYNLKIIATNKKLMDTYKSDVNIAPESYIVVNLPMKVLLLSKSPQVKLHVMKIPSVIEVSSFILVIELEEVNLEYITTECTFTVQDFY